MSKQSKRFRMIQEQFKSIQSFLELSKISNPLNMLFELSKDLPNVTEKHQKFQKLLK